jgi:putative transposase
LPERVSDRCELIIPGHPQLSIVQQCELLEVPRSSYYFDPQPETPENLLLMRLIDQQYLQTPFYGSRRMALHLQREGHEVNRKRVQRLMRMMGLEGLVPQRKTSAPALGHKVYPYLLRGLEISRPNHVWCSDITYIPMRNGFMYLVAVMDWFSRHVLAWRLSNTLDTRFCVEALDEALQVARPDIFNTDQGAQFTSDLFTSRLLAERIAISMDGRGRALDNVFIERLWKSVKYEEVYLKDYEHTADLMTGLGDWFDLYTHHRPHLGLAGQTPAEVYFQTGLPQESWALGDGCILSSKEQPACPRSRLSQSVPRSLQRS